MSDALDPDPHALFDRWLLEAGRSEPDVPTATAARKATASMFMPALLPYVSSLAASAASSAVASRFSSP